jgi:competence protein ComEC
MFAYFFIMTISMLVSIVVRAGHLLEAGFLLVGLLFFAYRYFELNHERVFWSLALGLCLGFLSIWFFHFCMDQLPIDLEREVEIEGEVVSVVASKDTLVVKVMRVGDKKLLFPQKILLRNVEDDYGSSMFVEHPVVGEAYRLRATIDLIDEPSNPGAGNFKEVYFGKGIVGEISSLKKAIRLRSPAFYHLGHLSENIRSRIRKQLALTLPDHALGFSMGMAVGDKSSLTKEEETALRNLGLSHILVVSSLHVGLLLLVIDKQIQYVKVSKKIKELLIILVLILLYLISYSKISVLKCFFIYGLHLFALVNNRKPFYLMSLALYVVVALIVNPYVVYNLSFTLSTMAYVGVFLFYRYTWRQISGFFRPFYLSTCIFIAISPVLIVSFGGVHYLGVFLSPVIMPVLELIIGLNFINTFIQFFVAIPCLSFVLRGLFKLLDMLVAISLSIGEFFCLFPYHSISMIAGVYLLFLLTSIRRKVVSKKIFMGTLLVMGCMVAYSCLYHHVPMRVFYLDVGMGDSALIYQGTTSVLIDGGTAYKQRILEDAMTYLGETKIDYAILSHEHQDHYGGIIALMEEDKIERVLLTPVAYESLKGKNPILMSYLDAGRLEIVAEKRALPCYKNWTFTLYPPKEPGTNKNNNSLICLLKRGELDFLFTGDVEAEEEDDLLLEVLADADIPIEYLKVPHHGSNTSSTLSFLLAAKPNYGMISVAQENRYGLPDPEVVDRYLKMGTQLHFTDEAGALEVCVFYPWVQYKKYGE